MTIRSVKISELPDLVNSKEYADWAVIPINPARAISQTKNPLARAEDIVLILITDDTTGEILSYTGAFPSKLNTDATVSFAWNSCWWAAEGSGGDVALKVFFEFISVWERKVAFSDMTEKTFKIIQNLDFIHPFSREGIILKFRTGFTNRFRVLSSSKKKISRFSQLALFFGLPQISDLFSELFLSFPVTQTNYSNDPVKLVKLISPETKDFEFISSLGEEFFCLPSDEELNMPGWLVKPGKTNRYLASKYYFSSFACKFSSFWLRWELNGTTKAVAMLSIRDGVLKTLYIFCLKDFSNKMAEGILSYCYSDKNVHSLITAQPKLTDYINKNKPNYLSRKNFTRYCAISKDLMKYFSHEPVLQDGDGDYRFT